MRSDRDTDVRHGKFIGYDARPGRIGPLISALPFVLAAGAYLWASHERLAANARDKLTPSVVSMWDAISSAAFTLNPRTGTYLLLDDWTASMGRLALGLGLAALTALVAGTATGLYPGARRLLSPFVTVASIVPPLALLPILFITLGTDEVGKVGLIYLGVVWTMTRDVEATVSTFVPDQVVKGLTLGATPWGIVRRVALPQVWPRLILSVRQNLGPAWLFLIAAEAIASETGLGYRIFLVRRYLAMDLIIPYAAVITLTGYLADRGLALLSARLFPWADPAKEK